MLCIQETADGPIVCRSFYERFDGKAFAQLQSGLAIVVSHIFKHHIVIGRIDNDGDRFVVLCGAADHRWPTDVDVFDRFCEGYVRFNNRRLEGVKIDHDQVNRLESALACFGFMFRIATLVKKPTVHARMQRFNAPFQYLGKCGETGNLTDGNFFLSQQLGSATSGNNVDALSLKRARE